MLTLCNLVDKSEDFIEHSCGKPVPGNELKIVDDNGEIVPVYTRGELYVRTKGMFFGYYNDQEKTRRVVTEDGWYKTDDVAFMTEDGMFYLEGRKSDMIISGVMNVSPAILEAILKNCPGLKDAMVVPTPHETLYQVICACFIPEPGSDLTEEHLRRYCEEMHTDKRRIFTVLPTYYLPFSKFPEVASGKPSRKKLIEEAVSRLSGK